MRAGKLWNLLMLCLPCISSQYALVVAAARLSSNSCLTGDCSHLHRDLVRLTELHKAAEERRFAKVAETLARADPDHAQVTGLLSMWFGAPYKSSVCEGPQSLEC